MIDGQARATWTAVWMEDGGLLSSDSEPEYKFVIFGIAFVFAFFTLHKFKSYFKIVTCVGITQYPSSKRLQ